MGAVATVAPVLGTRERLTVRSGGADAENPLGTSPGSQPGEGTSTANSRRYTNDLGEGVPGLRAWGSEPAPEALDTNGRGRCWPC
uniref:Uncharacterized protein n=1 Tax=uncultured prokaryote TaxID=198431 RepID=A0A0H5PXS9_9ZZZZ|nr:hypothetical protein [uncultured prokaryote]